MQDLIRVLLVEDTASAAALAKAALEAEGMHVDVAPTLAAARSRLSSATYDAWVLDVELPDGSGLELVRDVRPEPGVARLVLSSRQAEDDRVLALELGADDYLAKPFFPRELAARVRLAAARRARDPATPARLAFGDLAVDLSSREVHLEGTEVQLTHREFELLAHFARAPRQVFSRDDLLRTVWASSPDWQTPKTVTEHIRRLRLKIEPDPRHPKRIITVGRTGYRFDP